MTTAAASTRRGTPAEVLPALVVVLFFALAARPPETFGASMVACCVLAAVLAAGTLRPGPAAAAIAGAASLAVAASLAHDAPALALDAGGTFVVAALLGVAAARLAAARPSAEPAVALAAAGAWVAAHAVYQRTIGLPRLAVEIASDPTLPDHAELVARAAAGRAFALFGTPAALGGFLVLALPVTVGLAWGARRRGVAGLGWAAAALQVCGLWAAQSAGATAAAIAALGLAVFAWRARRGSALALLAGLALLVALLAAVLVARGEKMVEPSDPTSPWRLRAGNFSAAARMAADHPWIGVGLGGFAEHYPAYRRPGDNETRHVHDLPLELAAEVGWPAATVLAGLFLYLFAGPLLGRGAREERVPWHSGAALGLCGFALHNLVDFTAYVPSVLWSAALLRGALHVPRVQSAGESTGPARALAGLALAAGAACAALLALGGLADDARTAARNSAFAGDHPRAERLAERAVALAPWDADAALFLARATLGVGAPSLGEPRRRLALERAERAVALAPFRPAARETRARARLLAGDFGGAYADLSEAARRHPLHAEYARARDALRKRLAELDAAAAERS